MTKYKMVLEFKDGREIDSVLFNEKPTDEKAQEGKEFYEADSYGIEIINSK